MKAEIAALPASLAGYFDRTGIALSLSDASEDVPLVLVNGAFCALTGYSQAEIIGRNCRFLQGAETSDKSTRLMREFIDDETSDGGRFSVINYRKDGSTFHNLVFMTRLRSETGITRYILASQFDMTSANFRSTISEHDKRLSGHLSDIDIRGREFGLAMSGSAQILSDSIAMIARLSMDSEK